MNLLWVILATPLVVGAGIGFCAYLLHQAREVPTTLWILQHILCPIMRILVLLLVVSLVYPALDADTGSADFWRILAHSEHFQDLVNILFVVGLALAFVPLLNHPVFALPLQSMLTIALVFHWQHIDASATLTLLPSLATLAKILLYMLVAYFATREISLRLARRVDRHFAVDGSVGLIADALYLLLQLPVMLIYLGFLRAQLGQG